MTAKFAAAAFILLGITPGAQSAERSFQYNCEGLKISIKVDVDAKGSWVGKTASLEIAGKPVQTLVKDNSGPPHEITYKNKAYEFYSAQRITTLSELKNGKFSKFRNC